MPISLEVIHAREFLRVGAQGALDLAASQELLKQIALACQRRGIDRTLLDLRSLHAGPTPMLSREDLMTLVDTFLDVGFSDKQRLALLYSVDPHRRARMFAFLTTLRGGNVKACKDFEEALVWLSQGDNPPRRKATRGQKIPVRFAPERAGPRSRKRAGEGVSTPRRPARR